MAEPLRRSAPQPRPALAAVPEPAQRSYAECRALGHAWRHKGNVGSDSKKYRRPFSMDTGMVGYLSQCSQCKTNRVKWLTRSGEIVNRYEYPDGYAQHGEEVMSPRAWRTSFVASLFEAWEATEGAS